MRERVGCPPKLRSVPRRRLIGVVGAGGIGLELKHHVSTILLIILLTVVLLETVVGRQRAKLI